MQSQFACILRGACIRGWFMLLEKQAQRCGRISEKMGQVQQMLLASSVALASSHHWVRFLTCELRILDLNI